MTAAPADTAPLSDELLAMDVADTIRRQPELAEAREELAARYRRVGIDLTDSAFAEGRAAAARERDVPTPAVGWVALLARLHMTRARWLPSAYAITLMLVIFLGGYFLVWRPFHAAQVRQAEVELTETLPVALDALYETIHEETKVQQAENDAVAIRERGKAAAAAGDRAGALQAVDDLTTIRDTLRSEYQLKIVDQPNTKWGFWTFPPNNSEATNYYLVVQALDANGKALTLPIRDESTGKTDRVSIWAERVPEDVYQAVEADKNDNGAIEHGLIAVKEYGFLDPAYLVETLGGQLTRW